MTKLELINKLLFQFFFIRLTMCTERIVDEVDFFECSITPFGNEFGGTIKRQHIEQWYSIQYWILPLTGWRNNFIFIGKRRFFKITGRRVL